MVLQPAVRSNRMMSVDPWVPARLNIFLAQFLPNMHRIFTSKPVQQSQMVTAGYT
jgi:hypothetical protein